MLQTIKKRQQEQGFTIIEVLIVLAIAGLIMLIVFLAIPALQRNSRNTQRKNDVSAMTSAMSNFISNNNGSLPTAVGNVTADTKSVAFWCNGATQGTLTSRDTVTVSGANCSTTNRNYEQGKVGLYDLTNSAVFMNSANTEPAVGAPNTTGSKTNVTINSVVINIGYQCATDAASSNPTVNNRAVSVYYVTETGSGSGALQCVGS